MAAQTGSVRSHSLAVGLFIVILVCSILPEIVTVPSSYFSNKYNRLNQWFVKVSWGWTLCIMTPYLLLMPWPRKPGQLPHVFRNILRLVALTMSWYFWVEIVLRTVFERTGDCSIAAHEDAPSCRRGKGTWSGFDISGHAFLLVFIILAIQEELAPFRQLFESYGIIKRVRHTTDDSLVPCNLLKCNVILMFLVQVLSFCMVLATSLYFHTLLEKVIGTFIAILNWFLTYRVLFKSWSFLALPSL